MLLKKFLKLISRLIPDKIYLKIIYYIKMKKKLDLKNPKLFNEKLQWLKLYDRNPLYTTMVDKYESKRFVSKIIGKKYIIPTIGIYDSFDEINFDKLPNKFVLKSTNDSGGVVICKDKSKLNIKEAKNKIITSMKNNYYYSWREWPYKNVKPRIIIEKYMEDSNNRELIDYKIQCFNGKPDNILVCVDRYSPTGVKYHYFDIDWNYLPYCPYHGIDASNVNVKKPKKLKEMLEIATKLSKNMPQLRVDLYIIDEKIYFGELTLYTNGGFDTTITLDADRILGEKLEITSL